MYFQRPNHTISNDQNKLSAVRVIRHCQRVKGSAKTLNDSK